MKVSILAKKAIEATEQLIGKNQYLMQEQEAAIRNGLRDVENLPRRDVRRKFVERSRRAYYKKYGIWLSY